MVILLCVFGISACASKPESVTVEQIIEANDRQKSLIFRKLKSVKQKNNKEITVGIVLLPFIFQLVLGFGSSEYRPVNKGKSK